MSERTFGRLSFSNERHADRRVFEECMVSVTVVKSWTARRAKKMAKYLIASSNARKRGGEIKSVLLDGGDEDGSPAPRGAGRAVF